MSAEDTLARIRRAEEAILPLAASDIPFLRQGVALVLVQLRELRAFIDLGPAPPFPVEFE